MKTKSTLIKLLFLLPITVLFANCNKSGGSSNVSGYYIMNGACYASGTQTAVAVSNCQNGSQYTYQNGVCYNTAGANVGLQYCTGGAAVSGYYIANNACYISGTTTQTAITNCQTGTPYQYTNGVCYNTAGANVGLQYCTGSGTTTGIGTTGVPGTCNGMFYVQTYGGYTQVQCSAYNYYCRGQTVYTYQGQAINCQ